MSSTTTKGDGPNAASHRTSHEDNGDTSKGNGVFRGVSKNRRASTVIDADLKHEEGGADVMMADARPTYKSWKKKYRKMRIKFDESMAHGEVIYQQEQKALKKIKQLAIYNDRLLDLLTDINNRPQMPPEKRFDVSLDIPSDEDETLALDIDRAPRPGPRPGKSLKNLIRDVPHYDFATAVERYPDVINDLLTGIDSPAAEASHQIHPPSFLTADDIDNYIWEIDTRLKAEMEERGDDLEMLPTLAPLAREHNNSSNGHGAGTAGRGATPSSANLNAKDTSAAGASSISTSSRDFALRNPTSVYNWLRKHAPNTFLQDNDGGEEKKPRGSGERKPRKSHRAVDEDEDEEEEDTRTPARKSAASGGARKSGGGEGGRGSTAAARAKGERSSRRSTAASGKVKRQSMDDTMYDLDDELGFDASHSTANKGKRKRPMDDDTGYRPKGGSSRRPTKKRNKNSISATSAGGAGEESPVHTEVETPVAASIKRMKETKRQREEAENTMEED